MGNRFTNNYPGSASAFPTMENGVDVADHGYYGGLNAEIGNVEAELGLNPSGDSATVAQAIASIKEGRPQVTVGTDADQYDYTDVETAIAYLKTQNGGICYVTAGSYNIGAQIELTDGIWIIGEPGKTTLKKNADLGSYLITMNDSSYMGMLKDLILDLNKASYPQETYGARMADGQINIMNRVSVINSKGGGLYLNSGRNSRVINCVITSPEKSGIVVAGNGYNPIIIGNRIDGCGENGLEMVAGDEGSVVALGNQFRNCTEYGVKTQQTDGLTMLISNRFYNNTLGNMNGTRIGGYGNFEET